MPVNVGDDCTMAHAPITTPRTRAIKLDGNFLSFGCDSPYSGEMKMILFALAAILCAHQLQATLGETQTQLVKRYGKETGSFIPTPDTGKFRRYEFENGEYHITVTLLDGVSGQEVFTRKDKKSLDPAEMELLLEANALGSKWAKKDDNDTVIIWVLDSKEAFAGYYKKLNALVVKTADMLAFEEALMRQQQQQQQHAAAATPTPPKDRSLQP
jgi:hypothetical protein